MKLNSYTIQNTWLMFIIFLNDSFDFYLIFLHIIRIIHLIYNSLN